MNYKKKIAIAGYIGWCGLGFTRGINDYNYQFTEYKNTYNQNDFIYTKQMCYGIFGIIVYAHPMFLLVIIHKEMYRLEVNIRNLEKEKKSSYYHTLLF